MGDFYNRGGGALTTTIVTTDDLEVDSGTLSIDADNNRVGVGTTAPGTQLQLEGSAPYITLKNDTSENSDGGCEVKIIGEDHADVALGQIEISHNGSSDDTKGKMILSTHTGSTLTAAVTINDTQQVIVGDGKLVLNATAVGATAAEINAACDASGRTAAAVDVSADYFLFADGGATGATKVESLADYATAIAGTGLSASSGALNVDASQTGITAVGTIATGVWQGTAVASAYLDADTAHLSGTQTFSGEKTFSADATFSGDTNTFTSANSQDPLLIIKNTTNDANGARLRFIKDKGAAGAADDICGLIEFIGDDANQDQVLFGAIASTIAVHTDGQEGGRITLDVASHDGELVTGLLVQDGDAEDEIDVTLGSGTSSVTTVAGDMKLDGAGLKIKEAANAPADTAAYGQLWVKNTTPNDLYFTNDAGTDVQITNNAALASAATANDDANLILHMQMFT